VANPALKGRVQVRLISIEDHQGESFVALVWSSVTQNVRRDTMKKLIERIGSKIPLNDKSDSVWRVWTSEWFGFRLLMAWFITLALVAILAVLKAPILYRAYPYEDINLNVQMFFILLFAFFALLCIIYYFLSVLVRSIFRKELKKRIEQERKRRFGEAISMVEKSGVFKAKEALRLARTKRERMSVETTLKRYYERIFRQLIIPGIAEGGVSDIFIEKTKEFMEYMGIKNKWSEALLTRAIRAGKKIRRIREENTDLFQEQ